MQSALAAAGRAARDGWHELIGLVVINLIWLAMSVTVILLPPATAGLYAVTNSVAHGTGQQIEEFLRAARRYAWLSWRWALLNIAAGGLLYMDLVFYRGTAGGLPFIIRWLLMLFAVIWLGVQFYVWPFLIEQEDKRLRLALRNALFLALAAPVYTLTMLVIVVVVLSLSAVTVLPLFLCAASLVSLLGNHAVIERLSAYGKLPGSAQAKRGDSSGL